MKPIFDENSDISKVYFTNPAFYADNILTETFIEKYQDRVDWYWLLITQVLSEDFLEKKINTIKELQSCWDNICSYQKISEFFIEKYQHKINWKRVSAHQELSEAFIEKYKNKVNWDSISANQKLSVEFIVKYKDKLNYLQFNKFYLDNKNIG